MDLNNYSNNNDDADKASLLGETSENPAEQIPTLDEIVQNNVEPQSPEGYQQQPTGQNYIQPPTGQNYIQPPTGQNYNQTPTGQNYNQPPTNMQSPQPFQPGQFQKVTNDITPLVLGILSTVFGLFIGLVGILLGISALTLRKKFIDQNGGQDSGKTKVALVFAIIGLILSALAYLFTFTSIFN